MFRSFAYIFLCFIVVIDKEEEEEEQEEVNSACLNSAGINSATANSNEEVTKTNAREHGEY